MGMRMGTKRQHDGMHCIATVEEALFDDALQGFRGSMSNTLALDRFLAQTWDHRAEIRQTPMAENPLKKSSSSIFRLDSCPKNLSVLSNHRDHETTTTLTLTPT